MKLKIIRQIFIMSKYLFYAFFAQTLFSGLLLANEGLSQKSIHEVKLSVHFTEQDLGEVFTTLQTKTGFNFAFNHRDIDHNKKLSYDFKDESLAEILGVLSQEMKVGFKRVNNSIYVKSMKGNRQGSVEELNFGQQVSVKGIVTAADDLSPLPGVSILIKGTTLGTTTDVNGAYTLEVPNESILQYSYIGFVTQEIPVGNQSVINIQLQADMEQLDEVVVIGYGEIKKRDVTGAIGQVSAEKINELPVAGFDQAIQGKVSGVRVINSNAAPGGGFDIQIRGVGSINSSTYPLIVVDGMPLQDENYQAENNPFNLINNNDIESIEVLKDASSAAIYGARASNGVILITTKKGKKGKARLNFNMNYGFDQQINKVELANAQQYWDFYRHGRNSTFVRHDPGHYNPDVEASFPYDMETEEDYFERRRQVMEHNLLSGATNRAFDFMAYDTLNTNPSATMMQQIDDLFYRRTPFENNDYDWMNAITNEGTFPGRTQNYNLSASGGDDRVSYFISGSYFNQQGVVKKTDYERYTANINLNFKVNDFIRIGTKITPTWQNLNNIGGNRIESRWFSSPLYQQTLMFPPIFTAYDEAGGIIDYGRQSEFQRTYTNWGTHFFGNPAYNFERTDNRKTFRVLSNFWGEVTFLKNFKWRTGFLTDYVNGQTHGFSPSTEGTRFLSPGPDRLPDVNATSRQDKKTKWYLENTLSYKKNFNDVHFVDVVAGYTSEKTNTSFVTLKKYNFVSDEIPYPVAGSEIRKPEDARDGAGQFSFIGILARAQYNYKGKYYLTGSFRRDGSSRFGSETLWGNFPSVAVAWRVSEESFLRKVDWLENLKLRASFGTTGNSAIPNNKQQRIIKTLNYVINDNLAQGFKDAQLFDPALGWEKSEEINFGVDIGVLKGRVQLSTEIYNRTTTDMLLSVDMPQYSGFSSIFQNFGQMENQGLEITLSTVPVAGKVTWNADFNVSFNRGRVTQLFPNENQFISGQEAAGKTYTRAYVGGPMSLFWGNIYQGPFRSWEEIYSEPSIFRYSTNTQTMSLNSSHPGDMKVADVNGDGILSGADATVIGNPWPDFYWGFSNTVRWKNFDFYVQMDGTSGAEVYNVMKNEWFSQGSKGKFNMPQSFIQDYWTPDNPDAYWVSPTTRKQRNTGWSNSSIVEDGDFIAFRTIRLGYTLPQQLLQKYFINSLRFYANMQNAFFITKYTGFNPEGNNVGSSNDSRARNYGLDAGNYPISRTLSFGVDLTF